MLPCSFFKGYLNSSYAYAYGYSLVMAIVHDWPWRVKWNTHSLFNQWDVGSWVRKFHLGTSRHIFWLVSFHSGNCWIWDIYFCKPFQGFPKYIVVSFSNWFVNAILTCLLAKYRWQRMTSDLPVLPLVCHWSLEPVLTWGWPGGVSGTTLENTWVYITG